ncbi:hypothetical protein LTR16_001100 [Cryomyces antarcticus]|uniref:Alpha-1,3-mannosyltransferase n=1 Tax=Cryomyces antarcticus TaxID=329879 RepID=A0ABR0LQP1_9PEZI|nr:hypothetical protein LTR39_000704 [Cryomyces antarcticus]KAK5020441.1 hypothetical protein LTR60_000515 [Cryomyces antarcticus]KAK5201893.1 hypothetical protein LTR16_001100 [Cryomyces antarcticus]
MISRKEYHSYQPGVRQRRRTTTIRVLILALLIAITYTVVVSVVLPTHNTQVAPSAPVASKSTKDLPSETPAATNPSREEIRITDAIKSKIKDAGERFVPANTEPNQESLTYAGRPKDAPNPESIPSAQVKMPKPRPVGAHKIQPEGHARFVASLQRVVAMLPDEIHVRELLRSVEGTGKEKLREMGLRSRAFKVFYEAWEDLHFVTHGNSIHIRADVVQYLRDYEDPVALAQTLRSYEAFRFFLQRLSTLLFPWTAPYFADHMTLHSHFFKGGRGMVFTAGDDQAPFLLTSIPTFRRLGCNLPIEVLYLGDSDLGEDFRAQLEMLPGVVTRDLSQMVEDEGWRLAGWAAKPFAILMSSFREVIFVDADALFFRNPEILFEDPSYAGTGALFFNDRRIMPESKKRWLQQILPKPISKQVRQSYFWTGESGHMQESGVVVVDKWKHFVALLFVTRMNGPDRDGNKDAGITGVYDMVYGDKETFWIGWELVGDPEYTFHKGGVGIMGSVQAEEETRREDDLKTKDPRRKDPRKKHGTTEQDGDEDGIKTSRPTLEALDQIGRKALEPAATPQNFTICAPQLLHLGMDGRPLWFNGWILSNKFEAKKKKDFAKFEAYMVEPKEPGEVDAWQLTESNICCLTADQTVTFDVKDQDTLEMITTIAKGVYGKQ